MYYDCFVSESRLKITPPSNTQGKQWILAMIKNAWKNNTSRIAEEEKYSGSRKSICFLTTLTTFLYCLYLLSLMQSAMFPFPAMVWKQALPEFLYVSLTCKNTKRVVRLEHVLSRNQNKLQFRTRARTIRTIIQRMWVSVSLGQSYGPIIAHDPISSVIDGKVENVMCSTCFAMFVDSGVLLLKRVLRVVRRLPCDLDHVTSCWAPLPHNASCYWLVLTSKSPTYLHTSTR